MTLKELQNMIKEEFDAYMGEAEDDVDVSVSDNDVDAEMGDMGDNIDDSEEEWLQCQKVQLVLMQDMVT